MVKWMQGLDSAGRKGPERPLEGVLIVVEGSFSAERNSLKIKISHHENHSKTLDATIEEMKRYPKTISIPKSKHNSHQTNTAKIPSQKLKYHSHET